MENLTEEQRKQIVEETNKWIDENNSLAIDILSLSLTVGRIGLFERIFSKSEDKQLFNIMKKQLNDMNTIYSKNMHKIEVNERILGIKKPKKLIKNKTL